MAVAAVEGYREVKFRDIRVGEKYKISPGLRVTPRNLVTSYVHAYMSYTFLKTRKKVFGILI